jgi:hypothetical protein
MRRINPEPESWIHWTPLYWCTCCHQFGIGDETENKQNRPAATDSGAKHELVGAGDPG